MTALAPFILMIGVLAGLLVLPKVWRNEKQLFSVTPSPFWPLGKATWRGYIRGYPISNLLIAVAVVLYFFVRHDGGNIVGVGSVVSFSLLLALFVMYLGIMFFNRPRWLVAPHLRSQPGAVKEWSTALARSGFADRIRRRLG